MQKTHSPPYTNRKRIIHIDTTLKLTDYFTLTFKLNYQK